MTGPASVGKDGIGVASELADAVFPLNEFYARAGVPLPRFQLLSGPEVPEPWRKLLVHERTSMTPTLEAHHQDEIHIEVLGRERRGDAYFREVVLRLDRNDQAVELGRTGSRSSTCRRWFDGWCFRNNCPLVTSSRPMTCCTLVIRPPFSRWRAIR